MLNSLLFYVGDMYLDNMNINVHKLIVHEIIFSFSFDLSLTVNNDVSTLLILMSYHNLVC